MYMNRPAMIPDVRGKISYKKYGETRYVQYETGRRYDPDRKYNLPERVIIGVQIPGRPEETVPPNGNTLSKADAHDTGVTEGLLMPAGVNAEQKVSWIMAHTEFSEEQIGVIVEAMSQDLPPKYLLCFMKKEYSPDVMRQLKDYCTKLYQEERKNAPLPVESLNGRR